jgi:hypothetical protein
MRSMMAGMTDYTGVPLDDIVSHLRDWRDGTADTIKNLRGLNERVKVEKARLDGPTDILRYLDFFIDLFSRYLVDFERLLPELPENVSDAHIEMVRQIYDSSRQEDRTCVSFKQEHIERGLKDESLRPLVDNVYQETRGMIIDYRDLSNLIHRLRTFVGIAPNTGAKADRRFAEMAIQEALKSLPEDDRPHPLVGAVVVKNGVVVSLAHRGENPKCHAEYIALEEKLSDDLIAGANGGRDQGRCATRSFRAYGPRGVPLTAAAGRSRR